MPPPPSVSIIVPVHNDIAALRRLCDRLASNNASKTGYELIIAASNETEATEQVALEYQAKFVVSPANRGQQLNAGAALAESDLLWFVHADAVPPATALTDMLDAVERGQHGGWFRFRFSPPDTKARQGLAALINWRAERGVAYGDQGLFFTRALFAQAAGFSDAPLFEEVALVQFCKRNSRFNALDSEMIVDARRWERDGWIRRTLSNRALALLHRCGVPATTLARWYARKRRSE